MVTPPDLPDLGAAARAARIILPLVPAVVGLTPAAVGGGLPPRLLRDHGLEKIVLREALRDVLPDSVARRPDKAEALALMHAGLSERADAIRSVARGGPLADYGIIRPGRLLTAVEDYLSGQRALGPALWATVATDRWLTRQAGLTGEGT